MVRISGEGGLSGDSEVIEVVDGDGNPLSFEERDGKVIVTVAGGGGLGAQPPLENLATISEADPGAIGAGKLWVQAVGDPPFQYAAVWYRNDTDDGWNPLTPMSFSDEASTLVSSPSDNSEVYLTDNGAGAAYLKGNGALTLNPGGGGQAVLKLSGSTMAFFNGTPAAKPQVPASPGVTPQDIVDALVTLGLISQAT